MSIKQLNMAFKDTDIKGNEKLLMIALADFSNDSGVSFPSWNSLIEKTSMSKGSISKWLIVLEGKGLLYRVNRKRKSGANSSNKYLIYPRLNYDLMDEEEQIFFKDMFDYDENEIIHSSTSELAGSSTSELESEPSLINHHPKASLDEACVIFEKIWKEYTLGFLTKKKKRRGGDKAKAKTNFMKLYKSYTIHEIKDLVINEYRLNYNRDLERVLSIKSMKQFLEDRA